MTNKVLFIAVLILAVLGRPCAYAQSSKVADPSFVSPFSPSGYVYEVERQQDGKILVAGKFYSPSVNNGNVTDLVRLDANGSIDPSFTPAKLQDGNYIYAVRALASGKILIGGYFSKYNDQPCNSILRLNADGSIDNTFTPGTGLNLAYEYLKDICLLPDGKILAGGKFTSYNGQPSSMITRLNADGTPDLTFTRPAGYEGSVETIALQKDGKILIGGSITPVNFINAPGTMLRLDANGAVDATFHQPESNVSSVNKIVVLPDEKILVGGDFEQYDKQYYTSLVRLNKNGAVDNSFAAGAGFESGVGGIITYPLYTVSDLELQADGKILVSGIFNTYNDTVTNGIVRLYPDGGLEQTFRACENDYQSNGKNIQGILLLPDGNIIAAGSFSRFLGDPSLNLIMRLYADPGPVLRPEPDFEYILNGREITFSNTSTGSDSYYWNFGGDGYSSVSNPTHTFSRPGKYTINLRGYGYCDASTNITKEVEVVDLQSVYPAQGGNGGTVTVQLSGAGFTNNSIVNLVGQGGTIAASRVLANADGTRLDVIFPLYDEAAGSYDVTVGSGGSLQKLPAAYKIVQGGKPEPFAVLSGRDVIRAGRDEVFTITFGNKGDVDAAMVPLFIEGIPKGATWRLGSGLNVTSTDPEIPVEVEADDGTLIVPILLSRLPANSSRSAELVVNIPATETSVKLSVYAGIPLVKDAPPPSDPNGKATDLVPTVADCMVHVITTVIREKLKDELKDLMLSVVGKECVTDGTKFVLDRYGEIFMGKEANLLDVTLGTLDVMFKCGTAIVNPGKKMAAAIHVIKRLNELWGYVQNIACVEVIGLRIYKSVKNITVVTSLDPNDKAGPSRGKDNPYFEGRTPMPYVIHFENKNTATAAAQEVLIIDTLDTKVFDLSTFTLGEISFGKNTKIVPPPGVQEFAATVDLRPGIDLQARIYAKLDKKTGIVKWKFTSLDPWSLELTDEPLLGFLPPNVSSPEGEGAVNYTISLKEGLPQSTVINNKADIFFDVNAPIATNVFSNTLDMIAPSSKVAALPAVTPSNSFKVKWGGTDNGGGVEQYNVFYSVNNGPFQLWKRDTTGTEAEFTGEKDSTYRFYSIATDLAGNRETAKTTAETFTTVTVKDAQTITFADISNKRYGDADFAPVATSSSSLPITFTSSNTSVASIVNGKIHITGAGVTNITASQPGNARFGPAAPVTVVLVVDKGQQQISFPAIAPRFHTAPDFELNASSSAGLPVTYVSSNPTVITIVNGKAHITGTGKSVITATQAGNANYEAAQPATQTAEIHFTLPAANFKVSVTSETCRNSNNGQISITAANTALSYQAALIKGNDTTQYPFGSQLSIKDLSAGEYKVCISLPAHPGYRQCYDLSIGEPKDLSVYARVSGNTNQVELQLSGGATYHIMINNRSYTTDSSRASLPLEQGVNYLQVSTGLPCQGVYEERIILQDDVVVYPNPAGQYLYIATGKISTGKVSVQLLDIHGRLSLKDVLPISAGAVRLDVHALPQGMYILKMQINQTERTLKIFKK
ncbi:T9SS type A sorting domain-containing protein [Chitinophaga sp. YIM B06452]|uniref:DUF7619 domain-containing protein n=1 Tax=Chitinophaga sp. YIM B06452 TaxID=3082158 RepID=UPI0031FEB560